SRLEVPRIGGIGQHTARMRSAGRSIIGPPAFPADWRGGEEPRPAPRHGAELALVGLRLLPLVGHEEARDALWAMLGEVHADRGARAVVVDGPRGVGKTRLLEWFVERAVEVGAARRGP